MRLVILSSGNPNDMKGVMNFVQQEAKSLIATSTKDISVDVYLIRRYFSFFFRLIHSRRIVFQEKHAHEIEIDGVLYHQIWEKYGFWENIIGNRIRKRIASNSLINKCKNEIGPFDAIISHNTVCHYIANKIIGERQKKHICVWHGSDINIDPYENELIMSATRESLVYADLNLFVSRALLIESKKILDIPQVDVLYTGPSHFFKRFSAEDIMRFKEEFGLKCDVLLGFIGNIIDVKNVLTLPDIVARVKAMLPGKKVRLAIIGNGDLEHALLTKLKSSNIDFVYLGKQPPEMIPKIMNCLDVLILPSKNEGLPMVTLEALACGINVVASNVGGIKESIGEENCSDLDSEFVTNIANRICEILTSGIHPQPLPNIFSWDCAVKKIFDYLIPVNNG